VLLAGIALLGFVWHLLPFSTQASGMHFALALPGHLGLAIGLNRARTDTVSSLHG
jgi:hypothetical protein